MEVELNKNILFFFLAVDGLRKVDTSRLDTAETRQKRFCEGNSCGCPDGTCSFEPPLIPPAGYVPRPQYPGNVPQQQNPNIPQSQQQILKRYRRFCSGNSCQCPYGSCNFEPPLTPPSHYRPQSQGGYGGGGYGDSTGYSGGYGYVQIMLFFRLFIFQ